MATIDAKIYQPNGNVMAADDAYAPACADIVEMRTIAATPEAINDLFAEKGLGEDIGYELDLVKDNGKHVSLYHSEENFLAADFDEDGNPLVALAYKNDDAVSRSIEALAHENQGKALGVDRPEPDVSRV